MTAKQTYKRVGKVKVNNKVKREKTNVRKVRIKKSRLQ